MWCAVAAGVQGLGFVDGHEQQFVLVRHDHVAVQQVAQFATPAHWCPPLAMAAAVKPSVRNGSMSLEVLRAMFQRHGGRCRSGHRAGHQAHADFHQANVAFHGHHAACEYTASSQPPPRARPRMAETTGTLE